MQSQIANEEDYVLFEKSKPQRKLLSSVAGTEIKVQSYFLPLLRSEIIPFYNVYSVTWQMVSPSVRGREGTVGPMCRLKKVLLEK